MLVEYKNRQFKVEFSYHLFKKGKLISNQTGSKILDRTKGKEIMTMVTVSEKLAPSKYDGIYSAFTIKGKKDNFSKKIGRKTAIERLFKALKDPVVTKDFTKFFTTNEFKGLAHAILTQFKKQFKEN